MVSIMSTDSRAINVGGSLSLGGNYGPGSDFQFATIAGRKENSASNDAKGYLQFSVSDGSNPQEVARFSSSGNVGIGTTNPGELLSLGNAGTTKGVLSLAGNTSGKIIIQPQAVAGTYTLTLPATAGTSNQFLQTDGSGNLTWATGGGGSSALSAITAATTTNTIDSLNFAHTWNWSTANTQNPFTMNFNALTTGSALSLLTSNASLASTNGFLYVANTGAATGTTPFVRLQPNPTAQSGITLTNAGNVGIGVTTPLSILHLSSDIANNTLLYFDSYNATPNNGLFMRSARGALASPTAIQSGDRLGTFGAVGWGTTFPGAANVNLDFRAAETFTATANGTYITFGTTPIGSVSRTERMRIDSTGNVGVGTTNPIAQLQSVGTSGVIVNDYVNATYPGGGKMYTGSFVYANELGAGAGYVSTGLGGLAGGVFQGGNSTVGSYGGGGAGLVAIGGGGPSPGGRGPGVFFQTAGAQSITGGDGILTAGYFDGNGQNSILAMNGNVGIGTTAPGVLLAVYGNTPTTNTAQFGNSAIQ